MRGGAGACAYPSRVVSVCQSRPEPGTEDDQKLREVTAVGEGLPIVVNPKEDRVS